MNELVEYIDGNLNSDGPDRDRIESVFRSPSHTSAEGRRSNTATYLAATAKAVNPDGSKKHLRHIRTQSLVTRVLFAEDHHQEGRQRKPKGIGVDYLQEKDLYKAGPRYNSSDEGTRKSVFASKEVIVSGGAFNTPQLLKLSGIGPKSELETLHNPLVVDLPGVGHNLQDSYETSVVTQSASAAFQMYSQRTTGQPDDVCLSEWRQGKGPYTTSGATIGLAKISSVSTGGERDLCVFGGPGSFRSFLPGYSKAVGAPKDFFFGILRMDPGNRAGAILLKSADPRDVPEINFHFFDDGTKDDHAAEKDLQAMAEGVSLARHIFDNVPRPVAPLREQQPGNFVATVDEIKEFTKDEAYGHHASSTCAIGADSDPMACLDSRFRVRRVEGLRVVDASVFPKIPGAFPILQTFMVSEKATDVVLEDAHKAARLGKAGGECEEKEEVVTANGTDGEVRRKKRARASR